MISWRLILIQERSKVSTVVKFEFRLIFKISAYATYLPRLGYGNFLYPGMANGKSPSLSYL